MDTDTQPKQIIKMSVRNLVEFILRSGDIDNRKGKSAEREAMQEGSRIHRKIQRRMGADYYAEVPLKTEIETENYILRLEGRADGIIRPADKKKLVTIDEIKGVYRDVQEMEEAVPAHLEQGK